MVYVKFLLIMIVFLSFFILYILYGSLGSFTVNLRNIVVQERAAHFDAAY